VRVGGCQSVEGDLPSLEGLLSPVEADLGQALDCIELWNG
jgi:hypothetical protein